VQELQAAEDAGQRAWIIAHMPPGESDALLDQVRVHSRLILYYISLCPAQSNYFDQIVQRYRNTIAGQFFGHSHLVNRHLSCSFFNQ
jgi:sphingomyelin phosphodiesterase